MKIRISLLLMSLLVVCSVVLSGCGQDSSSDSSSSSLDPSEINGKIDNDAITLLQFAEPEAGADMAVMDTSMGMIKLLFFKDAAPKAVENFVTHAREGYYNGLKFHKVINDFMIQGGDPTGTGEGGESIFKDESGNAIPFEDEFNLGAWHFRGALSMVNDGADTNRSQFFIVQKSSLDEEWITKMEEALFPQKVIDKYKEVGGAPWLDYRHTVFGYVVEGMDVVDAIAAVPTDENGMPTEDVIINSVEITAYQP